ncbi:hypothetical protein IWZ00DRAFT_381409 [Phyllosticta capitalensis]
MDAWNGVFVCGRMSAENHRPGLIVFFSFQISPCVFCFLRPSAAAGSTAEAAQAEVRCRVQVRRVEIPPLAKHVCLYVRARTLFRVFPFFSSPLLFFSPCFLFCFSFYSLGFERESIPLLWRRSLRCLVRGRCGSYRTGQDRIGIGTRQERFFPSLQREMMVRERTSGEIAR